MFSLLINKKKVAFLKKIRPYFENQDCFLRRHCVTTSKDGLKIKHCVLFTFKKFSIYI